MMFEGGWEACKCMCVLQLDGGPTYQGVCVECVYVGKYHQQQQLS